MRRLCALIPLSLSASALLAQGGPVGPGTVSLGSDGLEIESADGRYTFEVGGRLHADWSRHSQLDAPATASEGTDLRRARISLGGRIDETFRFTAEYDFADDTVKDFWVRYDGWDDVTVTVGHQKQPYSLALEMSSNDLPFLERSIDNALISPFADRALGVRVDLAGPRWFAAAGVFGDSANDGDESWGTAARFVYAPLAGEDRVIHLGVRAAYREPDEAHGAVRIRDESTPFSNFHVTDTTPIVATDAVTLFGPEFALARGRFFVMSEYNFARIDRPVSETLGFSSWNVAVAWTLGGESRAAAYDLAGGEFKRLEADSAYRRGKGGGTWELAARIASLDLNDDTFVGGHERAASVGANWYANSNLRVLLDWTRVLDTDRSNFARVAAEDMNIVRARVQLTF